MKTLIKKQLAKMVKAVKPHFSDYKVTVHCGTTGKTLTYFAWTQEEAFEWVSMQCSDDLCIISSSWFGHQFAIIGKNELQCAMRVIG